ncbi:MAG: D-glycero-alpha-D-manno-heptose-1,7-bisphosphate 7-phosphatase [Phycisphaerales bacterium]
MLPAVFLDRDETLIANETLPPPNDPPPGWRPGDLYDPARVELLPGALEACRRLRSAGFVLVIVTNQGCVARGSATLAQVGAVNARVRELLRSEDGSPLIDAVYFVPYHPEGSVPGFAREHPWRKPGGGMIRQAAQDLGLDLSRSWLIGDAERDREAGVHAGISGERCLRCGPGSAYATVLDAARAVLA